MFLQCQSKLVLKGFKDNNVKCTHIDLLCTHIDVKYKDTNVKCNHNDSDN